jgi:hypothetical protein
MSADIISYGKQLEMINLYIYDNSINLLAYYEMNADLHRYDFFNERDLLMEHYVNNHEIENRPIEYCDNSPNSQTINWCMYKNPLKMFEMYVQNKSEFFKHERCFLCDINFLDCSVNMVHMVQDSAIQQYVMFISHPGGGGVEKHLKLMSSCCKKWFLIRPNCHMHNIIEFVHNNQVQYFHESNIVVLYKLCMSMNIKLIINNHLYIFSPQVLRMISALKSVNKCFMITLGHDMTLLCPTTHDMRVRKRINKFYIQERIKLIKESCAFVCPSNYLIQKYKSYCKIKCHMLNITEINNYQIRSRVISKSDMSNNIINIVVLGAFKGDKEMEIFLNNTPYVINFFGHTTLIHEQLINHGPYVDDEIVTKIRHINPHVIWFPSKKPETFCYALSYAIESGFPIIASKNGAIEERLSIIPHSYLLPVNIKLHAVFIEIINTFTNSIVNYNAIRYDRKTYMDQLFQLCNVSDIQELLCDH